MKKLFLAVLLSACGSNNSSQDNTAITGVNQISNLKLVEAKIEGLISINFDISGACYASYSKISDTIIRVEKYGSCVLSKAEITQNINCENHSIIEYTIEKNTVKSKKNITPYCIITYTPTNDSDNTEQVEEKVTEYLYFTENSFTLVTSSTLSITTIKFQK